jgi:hypothetical protein
MENGKWEMAKCSVFSIFHLPSAIQDAFFSILLVLELQRCQTHSRQGRAWSYAARGAPFLIGEHWSFVSS